MASTTGLVQKVKLTSQLAWVYIGNTPTNNELFNVPFDSGTTANEAALLASMVDTLTSCMVRGRQVEVFHESNSSAITTIVVHPT
jgi:hypothetical protein